MAERCNQCEALMINGIYCHEIGCPNIKENTMPDIEDNELDEEMEFPDDFEDDEDDEVEEEKEDEPVQ